MAAGQTILTGVDGNGNSVNILAGKDVSGDVSPGHTLFDVTGIPIGTQANPLRNSETGITLVSRSIASTTNAVSTSLVAANAARRILRIQAPQSAGLWINPLGGTCNANAIDCFYLAAGAIWESSSTNAVTYNCASGKVIAAVEG